MAVLLPAPSQASIFFTIIKAIIIIPVLLWKTRKRLAVDLIDKRATMHTENL